MTLRLPNALLGRAALLGATLAAISGCAVPGHYEGGSYYSQDKHVYVSREWEPKTITVVDTRTGEVFWTHELPVGRKLVMRFRAGKNDDALMPDELHWGEIPATKNSGSLDQQVPAPPASARRIEWHLRPVPESAPAPESTTANASR